MSYRNEDTVRPGIKKFLLCNGTCRYSEGFRVIIEYTWHFAVPGKQDHWFCANCKAERHFGGIITWCHYCPPELQAELQRILYPRGQVSDA